MFGRNPRGSTQTNRQERSYGVYRTPNKRNPPQSYMQACSPVGDSFCLMSAPIHSSAVPCLPVCVNREVFGYSGMDANSYSIKFFSGTLRSTGLMSPRRKASISFLSVQRPRAIIVRTTRASVVRSPAGITPSFRARTPTSY